MSDLDVTADEIANATELDQGTCLCCDFCYASEIEDIITNNGQGELRSMKRLEDGCTICQKCIDGVAAAEERR